MTTPTRIGAVVLAGGRVPKKLAHLCEHRALLTLQGRLLLDYLLDTLRGVTGLVDIAVVAPDGALPALAHLPAQRIAAGDSIVENMQRGAKALAGHGLTHLLFVTGDIPLVTVEGIETYITASVATGAALTYPVIPREASEARFPGAKRTYVKLQEGTFTGGNMILTDAHLLDDKGGLILDLFNARKSPLKLANILGWGTVFRLLTGTLALPYIEGVAARILTAPARAVICPHAEIGFDVDKPEDLAAVEQALAAERA
jgi:molybdopterin-guanine dinucleotide biosynthesis protein A